LKKRLFHTEKGTARSEILALFVAQVSCRFLAQGAPSADETSRHGQYQADDDDHRRHPRQEGPLHVHKERHHRPGNRGAGKAGEKAGGQTECAVFHQVGPEDNCSGCAQHLKDILSSQE